MREAEIAAAVGPFLPDTSRHGQQFAWELRSFMATGLSIAGYDELVFGEPRDAGMGAGASAGPCASSDGADQQQQQQQGGAGGHDDWEEGRWRDY